MAEAEERNIELHCDEMDEILGRTPPLLIRTGISVIGFVLLILFTGTFIFHYPDIINAPVIITSSAPPSPVVARTGGRIMAFSVKDKQKVRRGDYLAVLENASLLSSVEKLHQFLTYADSSDLPLQETEINEALSHLGSMQEPYTGFIQSLKDYQRYKTLSLNQKKIGSLKKQIIIIRDALQTLSDQIMLKNQNLSIAKKSHRRDSLLMDQNVLTETEWEKSQSQLINAKSLYRDAEKAYSDVMIEANRLEREILELELEEERESKKYIDDIDNRYRELKGAFDEWELDYVLKSPSDGIVSIGNYWSINQIVKEGDIIMSVVPETKNAQFGKITLPVSRSGKVKAGHSVNIKLSAFPYQEYGMLRGKVRSLSLVPEQGMYYVEVDLPDGLTTTYNIKLPDMNELQGIAEIITDDMRLIQRIFDPVRSFYHEKVKRSVP